MKTRAAMLLAGTVATWLGAGAPAGAALTGWDEVVVAPQTPGFTRTVTLAGFDPALGNLQRVALRLIGEVGGDLQFENLDATAGATFTAALKTGLTLERPLGTVLATATPTVQKVVTVTAADGLNDFGGTAGRSYLGLTAIDDPVYFDTTDPADLAFYGGATTFNLSLVAVDLSAVAGGPNFAKSLAVLAGARVAVQYEYTPLTAAAVPEPGSLALLGAGGGLLGLAYRRRRPGAPRV